MKIQYIKSIFTLTLVLAGLSLAQAQDKGNLGTEVVNPILQRLVMHLKSKRLRL